MSNESDGSVKFGEFSVLISVYSKSDPRQLHEAIASIWSEQRLRPSQLCIVEDGPLSEDLSRVLRQWSEELGSLFMIRVPIKNHVGLATALNKGLDFCKYPIVARMDADDISLPNRFEQQFEFLSQHPGIDVLGSQVEERDDKLTKKFGIRKVPLDHSAIFKYAKIRCPLNHPTVMFRKRSVELVGKYPLMYPEDYPLWGKMLNEGFNFANLSDVHVLMRSESAYSFRRGYRFFLGEIHVVKYLYDIRFITAFEAIISLVIRAFYRLCPFKIKLFLKSLFFS